MIRPGQILVGDVRTRIDELRSESVDTVITSPPYFRLRNYGHDAQIGLEAHVDEWVDELRLVIRGLRRVLKPSGSLWLNLGDTYARHPAEGGTPKSLVLAPERLALALVSDGWVLRNKVIWAKTNPMPTSVKDRLSCTWEAMYFFTREPQHYFDLDAIRVPHAGTGSKTHQQRPAWSVPAEWRGPSSGSNGGLDRLKAQGLAGHPLGKNPGDVWHLATAGYRGAHHAVYPKTLVERALLATCPPAVCSECAVPWRRGPPISGDRDTTAGVHQPVCACAAPSTLGIVLDPFMGSGTTAIVAEHHHRQWIGIELNPDIAATADQRIADDRARRASTLTAEDEERRAA
jgi:DNA modification methylase